MSPDNIDIGDRTAASCGIKSGLLRSTKFTNAGHVEVKTGFSDPMTCFRVAEAFAELAAPVLKTRSNPMALSAATALPVATDPGASPNASARAGSTDESICAT
jgi:hypothetical protein